MARKNKIHDLIQERISKQDTIKSDQEALSDINRRIMEELENSSKDRYEDTDGSATIVRPGKKKSYDWDKLKRLVGQLNWKAIVVEVPSEDLLERAVAEGRISPEVLGKCIVEREGGKPYVRVDKPKN